MNKQRSPQAPFLELQFYVGPRAIQDAARSLVPGNRLAPDQTRMALRSAVGLCDSEELQMDNGVLVLRTEGELFCGPEREDKSRLKKLGRKVYGRFVEVCDRIECFYGAILIEYSLEEPHELRADPRSMAFRDFFLNRALLGDTVLDQALRAAGADSYTEELQKGAYVSMTPEFNPKNVQLDAASALRRSVVIGTIVGRAMSNASP